VVLEKLSAEDSGQLTIGKQHTRINITKPVTVGEVCEWEEEMYLE
jgi:hypothetical protein